MAKKCVWVCVILMICILIVALVIYLLGKKKQEMYPEIPQRYIEGYAINNKQLNSHDISYPLDELIAFFEYPGTTDQFYSLDDINARFTISHLREASFHSYYLAYNVQEGGKYLVLLSTVVESTSGEQQLVYPTSIPGVMYIHDLPSEQDFSVIQIGDIYENVKELAPCTRLITVMSSSIVSYSLLKERSVMRCQYNRNNEGILVIQSVDILYESDAQYPFHGMVASDLEE